MCWREQARSPRSLVLSSSETSDRLLAPPRKTTVTKQVRHQTGWSWHWLPSRCSTKQIGTFQKLATKQIKTQKQIGANKTAFVTNHVKQIRRLHAMQRVSTLSVQKTSNPQNTDSAQNSAGRPSTPASQSHHRGAS